MRRFSGRPRRLKSKFKNTRQRLSRDGPKNDLAHNSICDFYNKCREGRQMVFVIWGRFAWSSFSHRDNPRRDLPIF